ncbi:SLAP domain-containing protein [Companilactobacillus allii]|uniref:S-layer protein C-terminal domain-containing protein n=1 Tax=Companilactobacillus allii TaxID=1847728 RepID=A0A1P8Q1H4_9LACO|nr:SLAP domain-containing protein [Companilactobacillus allii]APX71639.1 hypothetical protein BTM29_03285 [Companilactobacillus allii]USQ68721.1 SLAP domain-containing protein [Companilactobacillus allii]
MKKENILLGTAMAVLLAPAVLSNVSQNVQASSSMVGVVKRNGGALVDGNGSAVNRSLGNFTSWKLGISKTINGSLYYKVATNEWIKADSVVVDNNTDIVKMSGYVGTVLHGGASVVDDNGNYDGNYLGNYTSWKVNAKKTINGAVYYRVATNQWVDAGSMNVGYSGGNTQTTTPATNITKIPGYIGSVLHGGASVVDDNGNYNGNYLGDYTSWKVDAKKTVNGTVYYRVATNQWVSQESMSVGAPAVQKTQYSNSNVASTFSIKSSALRDFYDSSTNTYVHNPYGAGSPYNVSKIVKNINGAYYFQVEPNLWLPASTFDAQSAETLSNAVYEPYFATNVTK